MSDGADRPREDGDIQTLLLRLSDVLRPIADPAEIQREACRMLAEWLDVDRACYAEIDEAEGAARVDHDHVRGNAVSLVGTHPLADLGWSATILGRGECHVVHDVRSSPLVPDADRASAVALDIISFIVAPLIKERQLVGALCVAASVPRDWTGAETSLIKDVADRIWTAIELARAEARRKVTESRYQTLVDAMDDAVCEFERLPLRPDGLRDYRYISMNRAMQSMFHIPDLTGQSIRDNFPDEVEDWYDDYDRVLDTGEPVRIERETVPHGMVLEMFVTRIDDGSDRCLLAVIRDITKRKHAEAAVQASESRLRALVNATSNIFFRMSPDWKEMRELDGRGILKDTREPTTDWMGKYIAAEDQPLVEEAIRVAIETKGPFSLEHRVRRPDGSLGWTFSRAIPLMSEAGEIVEWFGAASDVTERRQAVEALAHTQRLDAVGRLAGSIAHDFNNLLTVVVANIELAEMRLDDAMGISFLDRAMKAAQLGQQLNRRLLSWAGQGPMQPQGLNLNDLVRDMASILEHSIGERIAVVLDLAVTPWLVFADPGHIESALLNLAVNARDAMPKGGEIRFSTANVTIGVERAEALPEAKAGEYVCLCVSDTGEGMTEEIRKHALEPFFTTKERGGGIGLGLFSVQSVVRQAGGFLEFVSRPEHGTTFRLYFPRDTNGRPGKEPRTPETGEGRPGGAKIRVLVVEDQEAVREVTRERLRVLGYDVVEAGDAVQALDILRADPGIGAVFSDVVMPGDLSGRDLARRVLSDHPGVAVLLTSGYTAETAPAGADDPTAGVPLLVKPYRLSDLAAALLGVLGPQGGGA